MYENLASFCQQDYPEYQIVFCIRDKDDPGITVVQQIIKDFSHLDIQLVVSDRAIGKNLKVSNLANGEPQAKHSILFLADSDIRVSSDYLRRVVQPLKDPGIGVVTCLYRSVPQGFAAKLEALIIATENLASVYLNNKLYTMEYAIGATIAIKRSVLNEFGGFAAIADYLDDDYQFGLRPSQLGHKVVLSDYVVDHVTGATTLRHSIQRMIRWACGTRRSDPNGYPLSILTFGSVAALLMLLATQGSTLGWWMWGVTWAVRWLMGWVVGVWALQDVTAKRLLWLAPLADLVAFFVWCRGFVGNTVEWRGQRLRVSQDGRLEPTA